MYKPFNNIDKTIQLQVYVSGLWQFFVDNNIIKTETTINILLWTHWSST